MIDRDALARDRRIIGYTIAHCPSIVSQMPRDIVEEAAYFGFAKAITRWDGHGKFSTHAFHTIRHTLQEQLRAELHNKGYTTRGQMPKPRRVKPKPEPKIESVLDTAAFRRGILAESGVVFG